MRSTTRAIRSSSTVTRPTPSPRCSGRSPPSAPSRARAQVDYAYALYNLGNALRLTGHAAEAIPYLEERLRISNYKRGVVKKELQTAKAQAA